MEQINRIELRGNVGNVKLQKVGDTNVMRFSLATNYAFKDKEGNPVIETTWHNVTAWPGKGIPDPSLIVKGALVHLVGRMRCQKFEGADGTDRTIYEVLASKVNILDSDEPVQPSFGI